MIQNRPPQPPRYGRTDGTYWPDGKGTIPLPVDYPDNGGTYIVIDISNASAGDSLDTLVFHGIDLLGGAVPMVAGDDAQSADDIKTAVETQTSSVFDGVANAGHLVIYRADGTGSATTGFSYTATTSNGTVLSVVQTRFVVEEAGTTGDGAYYLMDAFNPGGQLVDINTVQSLQPGQWLYFPQFHTLHKVVQMAGAGDASAGEYGFQVFLKLDPVPATSTATEYPVVQMPPQFQAVTLVNDGRANGILDGASIPSSQGFDRSGQGRTIAWPMTYDSTGTSFSIILNS